MKAIKRRRLVRWNTWRAHREFLVISRGTRAITAGARRVPKRRYLMERIGRKERMR